MKEAGMEQAYLVDEGEFKRDDSPEESKCDFETWKLGLLLASAYSLNYFWRYPIFMLPPEIANTHGIHHLGALNPDPPLFFGSDHHFRQTTEAPGLLLNRFHAWVWCRKNPRS